MEPLCATTSHKGPFIQDSKIFPVKILLIRTSSKRPPVISDRDHFIGLMVLLFSVFFLTSCMQPLDTWCGLCSLYVLCAAQSIELRTLGENREIYLCITWKLHAVNSSLPKIWPIRTSFRNKLPEFVDSRERPPPWWSLAGEVTIF